MAGIFKASAPYQIVDRSFQRYEISIIKSEKARQHAIRIMKWWIACVFFVLSLYFILNFSVGSARSILEKIGGMKNSSLESVVNFLLLSIIPCKILSDIYAFFKGKRVSVTISGDTVQIGKECIARGNIRGFQQYPVKSTEDPNRQIGWKILYDVDGFIHNLPVDDFELQEELHVTSIVAVLNDGLRRVWPA